ncbi:MAG TPA: S41 family peptidase [Geminicoccus sp.]|jgi:carboxyl-terminal processing protease|uniref:S41 family peptidase n=1 Tax=Geminicoccus sp. TaxID=2024832 RepID=UPI002E37EDE1|nr:S41 family peptidase [Geminicoccus sp.]HEX2525195.1 S41 family peptidase [Geminicoccus sp.]
MKARYLRSGLLVGGSVAVGVLLGQVAPLSAQSGGEVYRQLKLFADVFERVRADYVEDVPDQTLIENAINGMLTSLDPHSGYLDTERYRDMQVQTRGEFGGLGIEVTMENGLIKVVSPIDDTPAARAGVQAGDLITHIDNEPVTGLALSEAVDKMRGPVDTSIKLRLLRQGAEEPFDVTMARAIIKISPVRSHAEGMVGYVRLTTFSEQTAGAMRDAVEKLRADMGSNMQGLVLDLRNNPGGLLDQAVAVSDAFLDQGEIVSTRGRQSESIQRFNARKGDIVEGVPMVVLINGGSASASEIVAGALQDHRRAILMGTQSFGKGSVQTIMPIPGHGAIRLTTARYYTPAGTSIQAKGITPDIEVHAANIQDIEDAIGRREADLRGRLTNEQEEAQPEQAEPADAQPTDDQAPEAAAIPTDPKQDYQLSRAVDLLRGIALYSERGPLN